MNTINKSISAPTIRIASRESALALAQTHWVAEQLRARFGATVSILGMTTRGDQILDKPLAKVGGKGLFIKELEVALEAGEADIAVHSMKDMPMTLNAGFSVVVVGAREDAQDAFVSNHFAQLAELPAGSVVGTSSLRRESLLKFQFPNLHVKPLRGNVNTRLAKLDADEFAAIILACAGLKRLNMGERIRTALPASQFIPAIAQGALGIEYRTENIAIGALLQSFAAANTTAIIEAERAFGRVLGASCEVPMGAHGVIANEVLTLTGFVALPDGSRMVRDVISGPVADAAQLGTQLGNTLRLSGADDILRVLSAANAN
jgi:hydroxymethylbilane synthase